MTTEIENAEKQIEQIFENEFITLMDGDVALHLYKQPVPIDEDRELYQQGWRSYIYVKREYTIPSDVGEETMEYQHWAEVDKLKDRLDRHDTDIGGVENEATALASVLRQKIEKVQDDPVRKAYLEELLDNVNHACMELGQAAQSLSCALGSFDDRYEPEFGYFQVGIVSPTLAGVKACEERLKHISWPGGRPARNSNEWQMAACQELIFHGTCAPLLDFLAVTDGTGPDQRCLEFVKELSMTAGFQLDKQINAVGASGWDWLKGNPTGSLTRHPHDERGWHPDGEGHG